VILAEIRLKDVALDVEEAVRRPILGGNSLVTGITPGQSTAVTLTCGDSCAIAMPHTPTGRDIEHADGLLGLFHKVLWRRLRRT